MQDAGTCTSIWHTEREYILDNCLTVAGNNHFFLVEISYCNVKYTVQYSIQLDMNKQLRILHTCLQFYYHNF